MNLKYFFVLAVFGFCIFGVGGATVSSEEERPAASTTSEPCHTVPSAVTEIPFRTCYIDEARVSRLMTWMTAVLAMLNTDQDYTESKQAKLKKLSDLEEYEVCSDQRIHLLTEELRWVSRRLWVLSIRLEEPLEAEVQLLDKKKVNLIRHLNNVRVVTGGLQLLLFDTQVEFLKYGLNTALTMFQVTRPTRPCRPEDIIPSILHPMRSFADILEMSRNYPKEMSEALPKLVSNWYSESLGLEKFDRTLQLVNALPALDHRVIGYVALHDEMRKSDHLETYELTLLVAQLKEISSLVTSASSSTDAGSLPLAVVDQYKKLVEEVGLIYKLIGQNTKCEITSIKYPETLRCCAENPSYIFVSPDMSVTVFSSNTTARALFKISHGSLSHGFYSLDSLSISDSKRALDYDDFNANNFQEWKLIPVQGGKYFKILNAQYDEVLYADKEKIAGKHRVFLAKNTYLGPRVYEDEEALWSFACK